MSEQDIESIADKLVQKLEERRQINAEQHQLDHEWVKNKREQEQAFKGARGRLIEKIVGSVAIVAVLGFIGWIGHAALTTLQDMIGRGGPP